MLSQVPPSPYSTSVRGLAGRVSFLIVACVSHSAIMAGEDFEVTGTGAEKFRAAIAAAEAGKTDQAIRRYQQYAKLHTGVPATYYYLGNLYWDTGQKVKARQQFKRAKAACPG